MTIFGRASDNFGRRPVYLFSILVFFVSTAWCGAAQSIGSFIAARAFSGFGGGGVTSLGMIICNDIIKIEYRGIYQAYTSLCLGTGAALGLVLGGFLCDKVGWRGAFWVQMPFFLAYFLLSIFTVPGDLGVQKPKSERMTFSQLIRSIDMLGSVILVAAVTALIMGLNLGGNVFNWGHPIVIGSLAIFFVLAVVFVVYERKVEQPVMPLKLLTTNPRAGLIFGNFFGCISGSSMVFNAPLFFQAVKLESASESGMHMLGPSLVVTATSFFGGFLITYTRRCKPTLILSGLCLTAGGVMSSLMHSNTPDALAMACIAISNAGQGLAYPSIVVSILATSEQEEQAMVITTFGLWGSLGSVMGVTISSWIFQNMLVYKLNEAVTGLNKEAIILMVRKSVQSIVDLDPLHQQQGKALNAPSFNGITSLTFAFN